MMQSHKMHFDFGSIHYQTSGTHHKENIIFLHAFHSSSAAYQPLCEQLIDHYNLICLDFPGHGASDHLNCDQYANYYSVTGFTHLLIEFIKRLNLSHYYIAGDSVGGNCAIRALDALPGLSGLILLGTAQAHTVEMVFSLHHQSKALDLLFQTERCAQEDEIVACAYVNPTLNAGNTFKQMLHDLQHTDKECRRHFANSLETQPWVDELAIIEKTSKPLIYILGEDDGFIDSVKYKKTLLSAGLKSEQIFIIEKARHIPQLDAPQTSAKIIKDFIKSTGGK